MTVETDPTTLKDLLLVESYDVCQYIFANYPMIQANANQQTWAVRFGEQSAAAHRLQIGLVFRELANGLQWPSMESATIHLDSGDGEESIVVERAADSDLYNDSFSIMFLEAIRDFRRSREGYFFSANAHKKIFKADTEADRPIGPVNRYSAMLPTRRI